jgi:hypothetical protein
MVIFTCILRLSTRRYSASASIRRLGFLEAFLLVAVFAAAVYVRV